jgi:hypothetical protein
MLGGAKQEQEQQSKNKPLELVDKTFFYFKRK